jgi:hypothetical protein
MQCMTDSHPRAACEKSAHARQDNAAGCRPHQADTRFIRAFPQFYDDIIVISPAPLSWKEAIAHNLMLRRKKFDCVLISYISAYSLTTLSARHAICAKTIFGAGRPPSLAQSV